jgi:hypothetical protein
VKTPTDISKRRHLYFQELPICQILRLGGSPRIQMLHQCFGNEYNDYTSDFSNLHNLMPEASILGLRLAIIGIARSRDNWRARATFHIGYGAARRHRRCMPLARCPHHLCRVRTPPPPSTYAFFSPSFVWERPYISPDISTTKRGNFFYSCKLTN